MALRISSFRYAFWSLVMAIFLIAVAASSMIVWWTSQPFLLNLQEERLNERMVRDGLEIRRQIDDVERLLSYVATEPVVVGYVIGDVERTDAIVDRFAALNPDPGLLSIALYDFEGARVLEKSYDGEPVRTHPDEDMMVRDAVDGRRPGQTPVLLGEATQSVQILTIAVPVLNRNLVEGMLAATMAVSLPSGFTSSGMVLGDRHSARPGGSDLVVTAPITGTTLSIHADAVSAEVVAAGRELVRRNMVAVGFVLLLPFLAFGLIGRSVLLKPHEDLEQSRDALREQQKELKELAAIARAAEECIIVTDLAGRILWVNPSFERLSGRTGSQVCGRSPGEILQGPDTDPATVAMLRDAIRERRSVRAEILNYDVSGRAYWISLGISPLLDEAGQVYGFMSVGSDITAKRAQDEALAKATAEIEHQALHDKLTGLPNRRHFELAFERCREAGETAALVRIDLDHFKYVNDTHGHEAGDAVLAAVAQILQEETRDSDLPVRIGGDEFIVLMRDDWTTAAAEALAGRLQERIRQPILFDGTELKVGASFGIATTRDRFVSHSILLRAADAALYKAKDAGRNAIRTYSSSIHSEVTSARELSQDIRRAVEQGQFVPYYQLQFDAQTRNIAGVEVLARWDHPTQGVLTPENFLAASSQIGLLARIDEFLMTRALDDIRSLVPEGFVMPKMAFNITADRLLDTTTLIRAIDRPLNGTTVAFEILESVLLEDQAEAIDLVFDLLREFGISIEIDDFGSGHASIVSLMRMRPDVLKIDQRLVRPIPESQRHRDLVASLIRLAGSLDVSVTAEGVSSERHAQVLTELGTATLQGYHLARPMCFADLRQTLRMARGSAATPEAMRA